METALSRKGQTNVPAEIRRRHQMRQGSRLLWIDDGVTIRLIPKPNDPIAALQGSGQGEGLVEKLLADRRAERAGAR